MITKDPKKLFQRLNEYTTKILHDAVGFCVARGHYEVTTEHLLLKSLEEGRGDVTYILDHFEIKKEELWQPLLNYLEKFRSGNTGRPSFSPMLLQLMESAWITASLYHDLTEIRSGNLFEILIDSEGLKMASYMDVICSIRPDVLRDDFLEIVKGSVEDSLSRISMAKRSFSEMGIAKKEGETALDLYTTDFTGKASEGKVDPVFGRDKEIRQMIDILSRRRKNNPILVGEAGVGKTAVVEGLAVRIAQGDVPDSLKEVEIRGLDMGLLQAGAGVKGEFENRLKTVIQEVKEYHKPIILFIDEAHALIGAGGSAGTGDAANLLKPALARGELRTVAATTWSEYKKYMEKDAALERRFQLVKIDEPSVENATTMMRGIKSIYEAHHDVQVSDEAISELVKLADRFISGRYLPDKSVDLLDTTAARVKMAQTSKPAIVDDAERRRQNLDIEIAALQRDLETGVREDLEFLEERKDEREKINTQCQELEEQWQAEREIVKKINELRKELNKPGFEDRDQLKSELKDLENQLRKLQVEKPLVYAGVSGNIAAQVVSDWTGIPAGNMIKDEADILLDLEDHIKERILGQDYAIQEIADVIRTSKAGLRNPESPIGVFLFVGPSGVGKTECGLALADLLFGGEKFLTIINMSEYQESHTVSQLKGSPPGYVGYGEGGILTEAVRQRPYSVVLMDEIEKAHRDVMNLFYQVFDKGFMRDGEGREIDFKNTVIIMTSNLGAEQIVQMTQASTENGENMSMDGVREAIQPALVHHFKAALLGRLKVVPFLALDKETMSGIVEMKLDKIGNRLAETYQIEFQYDLNVIERITERCTQIELGARNVDFIVDRTVLPEASKALLEKMSEEDIPSKLILALDDDGNFNYIFKA